MLAYSPSMYPRSYHSPLPAIETCDGTECRSVAAKFARRLTVLSVTLLSMFPEHSDEFADRDQLARIMVVDGGRYCRTEVVPL